MAPSLLRDFKIEEIVSWTALRFAEETEAWESVERLLAGGAAERDLVGTRRKLQNAADAGRVASEMCRRGCQRLLRCALAERPALATARLPQQRTLLHVAAEAGSVVALRSLLDAGASANARDRGGVTPLHEAAAHCCYYALLLLLKAGADAGAVDQGGRTALHYAARGGSVPAIQVLMSEGLRTDAASASGWTPLHEAAAGRNPQCVLLLLESGADAQATTAAGWTALHAAAAAGTIRAVRILLDAGVPVDARTLEEETALHLAAERGADDVVTMLAEAGADLEAVDRAGRTPSRRAAERRLKEEVAVARALSMSAVAPEEGDAAENTRGSTHSPSPENTEEAAQEVEMPPPDSDIPCGDDVSEYSYLSDQSYSDSCSESDGECSSVDTASEKYTSYETLPSTASTTVMGNPHPNYQKHPHSHRGMYRGRGRGRFVKSGSTDAIFKQSQGKGHHQAHTKQHSGHHQEVNSSGENKHVRTRPRNRHRQQKHEQQTHQHQNQVPHALFQHQQQQQPHKQHPQQYQHNKKQHKQQQNQQGTHNKPANNTNPHGVGKQGVNMNLKIPQLQGFVAMNNPFISNQQLFPTANVNNRSPQGNSGHTAQNRSQQSTAASNLVDELERLKQRVNSIAFTPPQKVNRNQK